MTYRVVITNWWKETADPNWPDGLEPDGGIVRVLMTGIETEARAREIARGWNAVHNPGRLSTKAEIERE